MSSSTTMNSFRRRVPTFIVELGLLLLTVSSSSAVVEANDASSIATSSPVAEFCQAETFQASCAADEVVTIETAQYGRLNIGKCVTEDFGYLRCLHDVMPEVESACSGRRSCQLRVDDTTFSRMTPCHRDLKSNLLASYRCTKVVLPNTQCKFPPGGESIIDTTLSTTSASGLISSYVTEETGCGTADWPWTVVAGPGQRINLTLLDFSREAFAASLPMSGHGSSSINDLRQPHHQQMHSGSRHHVGTASQSGASSSMTCRVYATIRDGSGGRSTTVCGGLARSASVFVSATNRVEIRFLRQQKSSSPQQQPSGGAAAVAVDSAAVSYFLLRYDVVGCVDPPKHPGMQMKRDGDVITISCDPNTAGAETTWRMTCSGNTWIGSYENCTTGNHAPVSGLFASSAFNYAPPVIIIVVIAVLVVCFILTIGTLCIRWRLRKDYSSEVRTQPTDMIADYDYQYRMASENSQPLQLGIGNDKPGVFPVRTRYPANYDSTTSSAAVLTGNEYATMRLLQLAPYSDLPSGSDRPYGGSNVGMTEHIYESPDSMRRVGFMAGFQIGDTVCDDVESGTRHQPYRVFETTTAPGIGGAPWNHQHRARALQYQQQQVSMVSGQRTAVGVTTALPNSGVATGPMCGGFKGGERCEMPAAVHGVGDQQRLTATPTSGNYSL